MSDWTLTPEDAAEKIVAELCSDLPQERRILIKDAIETAMREWGDLVGSVAYESTWR